MAFQKFQDSSSSSWAGYEVIQYGKSRGYEAIGVIGTRDIPEIVLFELDNFDKGFVADYPLKANEKIVRYATRSTIIGDYLPLLKVNLETGRGYWLTDQAWEEDTVDFISHPFHLRFARTLGE